MTAHPIPARSRWHALCAVAAALLVGLVACSDDPFQYEWYDTPDTAVIYSLQTPVDLNLPAGFSFYDRVVVQIEEPDATGNWDFALGNQGGALVALPPGALGITARAAIASLGTVAFDDIRQAPSDTLLYELNNPVPLTVGETYVVRTNRRRGSFGSSCVYYAKFSPTVLDVAADSMQFQFVASPLCNSRDLFSPK